MKRFLDTRSDVSRRRWARLGEAGWTVNEPPLFALNSLPTATWPHVCKSAKRKDFFLFFHVFLTEISYRLHVHVSRESIIYLRSFAFEKNKWNTLYTFSSLIKEKLFIFKFVKDNAIYFARLKWYLHPYFPKGMNETLRHVVQ